MVAGTILAKSRNKPRDVLKGVLGVASTFATPPTSLANITDGNVDTVTGEGVTVGESGAFDVGYITFDLGSAKNLLLTGKVGVKSSSGAMSGLFQTSSNNSTWTYHGGNVFNITSTNEYIIDISPFFSTTRYIRFRFRCSASATATVKIYSMMGYEL